VSGLADPRTAARKRALDILYEADVAGRTTAEVLATADDLAPAARTIVEGVGAQSGEIDALIRKFADRWSLERMPVVDRNLLRIGIFELLWSSEVPPGVAINEAVELAKLLSTEDSGRFVNGLLGRIAREHGRG
jgi:transcription antitermination protein NusB